MVRIYHEHPDCPPLRARTFGPLNRFDPHVRDGRQRPREQSDQRGVNYVAEDLGCGLAEAFPEQRPEVAICPGRRAVLATPAAPVTLLDLTGDGAMKIGAVGTLGSGNEPRRLTQRWGRAIYEDLPAVAGIRYRAAHQGGVAVAVWERAGVLEVEPGTAGGGYVLLDPGLFARVTVALAAQGRYPRPISAAACPSCRESPAARAGP